VDVGEHVRLALGGGVAGAAVALAVGSDAVLLSGKLGREGLASVLGRGASLAWIGVVESGAEFVAKFVDEILGEGLVL
jgi:hypothetical protein